MNNDTLGNEKRQAIKIAGGCVDKIAQALIDMKHGLVREYGTQKALAIQMGVDESTITRRFTDDALCDFVARLLALSGFTIVAIDELDGLYVFARKGIDVAANGGVR